MQLAAGIAGFLLILFPYLQGCVGYLEYLNQFIFLFLALIYIISGILLVCLFNYNVNDSTYIIHKYMQL